MIRETIGLLINLRTELQEVRLSAGFGQEVLLSRGTPEVFLDYDPHEDISAADYYLLFGAGDPVWSLTLSEPLPDRPEYAGGLSQMPEELLSRQSLEALDEVVTALRLVRAQGVWLPLAWLRLWSDNGQPLATNFWRSGERWEACEEHVAGETAREDMEPYTVAHQPVVERYGLEVGDIPELQDVLDGLSRRPLDRRDGERSRIEIAISRFNMALDRPKPVDQVIDLSVALETLFTNPDENNIKSNVSVRGATYLESSFQSIKELSGQVKRWYHVRSSIVHGDEPPRDLSQVVNGLASVVRRSLRKALADPASLARVREGFRGSAN